METRLCAVALLTCALTACSRSGGGPPAATPTRHVSPAPTKAAPKRTITARATSEPKAPPSPPALYSQEHVGNGKYQLLNNFTYQFVQVTAGGVRTTCPGGGRRCADYVMIGVTEYSGNTPVTVSRRQFALASARGVKYAAATAGQAARVLKPNELLPNTALQPDDDGDYASGTLVFVVPQELGRFSVLWQGLHVATLVKTAHGKLYETR